MGGEELHQQTLEWDELPGYQILALGRVVDALAPDPHPPYAKLTDGSLLEIQQVGIRKTGSPLVVEFIYHRPTFPLRIVGLDQRYTRAQLMDAHRAVTAIKQRRAQGGAHEISPDDALDNLITGMVAEGKWTLRAAADHWQVDDSTTQYWRERSGLDIHQIRARARQVMGDS